DAGDDHLWALVQALEGTVLVTGDLALHRDPLSRVPVLLPRDYRIAVMTAAEPCWTKSNSTFWSGLRAARIFLSLTLNGIVIAGQPRAAMGSWCSVMREAAGSIFLMTPTAVCVTSGASWLWAGVAAAAPTTRAAASAITILLTLLLLSSA